MGFGCRALGRLPLAPQTASRVQLPIQRTQPQQERCPMFLNPVGGHGITKITVAPVPDPTPEPEPRTESFARLPNNESTGSTVLEVEVAAEEAAL